MSEKDVARAEAASMLYALHRELNTYTTTPMRLSSHVAYNMAASFVVEGLEDLYYTTFHLARRVHLYPNRSITEPHFNFTNAVLDLIKASPDSRYVTEGKIRDEACFEAELRLMRSLGFHESSTSDPSHRDPAAILFDIQNQPFAYRKTSGLRTAFAWRGARFMTESGPKWVPESSFFKLIYKRKLDDPRYAHFGKSLVALSDAPFPKDIRLLRFSTHTLPEELASRALLFGANGKPKLRENLQDAIHKSPQAIGDYVCSLIDRGIAVPFHTTTIESAPLSMLDKVLRAGGMLGDEELNDHESTVIESIVMMAPVVGWTEKRLMSDQEFVATLRQAVENHLNLTSSSAKISSEVIEAVFSKIQYLINQL